MFFDSTRRENSFHITHDGDENNNDNNPGIRMISFVKRAASHSGSTQDKKVFA